MVGKSRSSRISIPLSNRSHRCEHSLWSHFSWGICNRTAMGDPLTGDRRNTRQRPSTDDTDPLCLETNGKSYNNLSKCCEVYGTCHGPSCRSDLWFCTPTAHSLGRSRVCESCSIDGASHGSSCSKYECQTTIPGQCRLQ